MCVCVYAPQVVNGLMEREDWREAIQIPLGILPGGSGNALSASIHHYSGWVTAQTYTKSCISGTVSILMAPDRDYSIAFQHTQSRAWLTSRPLAFTLRGKESKAGNTRLTHLQEPDLTSGVPLSGGHHMSRFVWWARQTHSASSCMFHVELDTQCPCPLLQAQ